MVYNNKRGILTRRQGVTTLPFFTRDDEGNIIEIPLKMTRSPNYRKVYAHGAQGGILGSFHYRIDFYCDHIPPLSGKVIGDKIEPEEEVIIREIDTSVYLSLPFAKQLRDWLDKNIKEFEEEHGEIKIGGFKKTEEIE